MTRLFASLLVLYSLSLKGQFIFTPATTNPAIGENYFQYAADTAGIVPGPAGANQTWDFQYLTISTATYDFYSFVLPDSFSFPSCFLPGGNFNSATAEDSVRKNYYQGDTNQLAYLGNTGCNGWKFTNCILWVFPFSYGSSFQNTYSDSPNCCLPNYGSTTMTKTYDAYGTLKLPGITYSNTARVRTFDTHSRAYGQGKSSKGHKTTYDWFENGIKYPVLTITEEQDSMYYGSIGQWFPGSVIKKVKVLGYSGVGIDESGNEEKHPFVFPNPSDGKIAVRAKSEGDIYIYNALGKKIIGSPHLDGETEIDLSKQPNGIYLLELVTGNGPVFEKFVIYR